MATKKPTVTSSSTRSERIKGNAGGSKPSPRPTTVSTVKQQGPIAKAQRTTADTRNRNRVRAGINQNNKPGAGRVTGTMGRPSPTVKPTVTQGGTSVNSNTPAMRQIQAKAEAARARAAGKPGIKGPITLPNSQRAGVNLPRVGAQVVKPEPGQMSPARMAAAKAQGQQAVQTAQQRRANQAANEARRAALKTKTTTEKLQKLKGIASNLNAASIGTQLFMQGKSGSELNKAVQKLPGIKANQKTDLGARASRAITSTAKRLLQGNNSKPKAKMGPAMPARLATVAQMHEKMRQADLASSPNAQRQAMARADAQTPAGRRGIAGSKAAPLSSAAKSFDKSFASARKAGKSVFTWRGKKYNTKLKGE